MSFNGRSASALADLDDDEQDVSSRRRVNQREIDLEEVCN